MINKDRYIIPDTLDMQIETLVRNVYDRHITEHGDKFYDDKEAFDVIDYIDGVIRVYMNGVYWELFDAINRINDDCQIDKNVKSIRMHSEKLIEKALLMMAVCDKYKNRSK